MKDEGVEDLRRRTKRFALAVIHLFISLPKTTLHQVLGKQLLRAGTSIGAQYAESYRSRSTAESISKLEAALQEPEETRYWLELLSESGCVTEASAGSLQAECDQLTAILVSCVKKMKSRKSLHPSPFILHPSK